MKRRDFLKGMMAAAAIVAVPITLLPQTQALARKTPWRFLGSDRDIRFQTTMFVFEREQDGEIYWAEIRVPFKAEGGFEEAQVLVEGMFP